MGGFSAGLCCWCGGWGGGLLVGICRWVWGAVLGDGGVLVLHGSGVG